MTGSPEFSAVVGAPRLLLRLEGLGLAAVSVALYAWADASWWLFSILILAPDLSMLGYLAGPRIGAAVYNAVHTLIGPMVLGLAALLLPETSGVLPVALIWAAHIGLDRALGYGLKYPAGFGFTHLGRISRQAIG